MTIGALSSSVNLANNLRDIPTDSVTGKITLAVRLGDAGTRALWLSLVGGSVVLTIALALGQLAALLGLLAVPLWVLASGPVRKGAQGKGLIPVLGLTGRGMLLWSVMMLVAAFI